MFKNWGIKQRVLVLTLIPTFVISLLMGIYFASVRIKELNQGVIDRGTAIVSQLASTAQQGVFTRDYTSLRQIAKKEISKEISSIVFYNYSGTEIASAGKLSAAISPEDLNENEIVTTIKYPNSTAFIIPIILPEALIEENLYSDLSEFTSDTLSLIGWVKIELELEPTKAKIYKILLNSSLIVLLGLIISGLVAFRMGNNFTKPIISLTNAVEKIKLGKLETRSNTKAKGELEILQSGINTMAKSLENIHKEMQYKIDQATHDLRKSLHTIEIQNKQLDLARKKAENLSNIKSEFIANMSHELRTPLNGMLGFIHLLQKTTLQSEQKDFIRIIETSANNLIKIINNILDFSKIEAGDLHFAHNPMNLHECVEDAVISLAPHAHEKFLEIAPFIYSDVPKIISQDKVRITQVISNLVSNAIKFTKNGSIVVRTMLEKKTGKKIVICISVTDTGIGLSQKEKDAIYKAFSQTNPNITRKFGGTGLGLIICKKIVDQMNGKIGLESSLNKGSTFWFTFEADLVDEKNIPPHELTPPTLLNGLRVLLFDQHYINRFSLKHLLNSWGIDVIEVDSINNLHSMVQKYSNTIHMALLGISHKHLNKEVLKNLFMNLTNQNIHKIGVLVNTTNLNVHKEILNLGINLCLAKPIYQKKLFKALCELFIPRQYSNNNNNNYNSNFLSDPSYSNHNLNPFSTSASSSNNPINNFPTSEKLLQCLQNAHTETNQPTPRFDNNQQPNHLNKNKLNDTLNGIYITDYTNPCTHKLDKDSGFNQEIKTQVKLKLNTDYKTDKPSTLNILTVDDNYANLKLVRTILENIGMKVTTASNGKAAIAACVEQKYDIIFMDINMPSLDGIETTKIIKNKCNLNYNTPIIALSAFLVDETKEEILQIGMQDYVSKPVTENQLKTIIYKWSHQNTYNHTYNNTFNHQNSHDAQDICNNIPEPTYSQNYIDPFNIINPKQDQFFESKHRTVCNNVKNYPTNNNTANNRNNVNNNFNKIINKIFHIPSTLDTTDFNQNFKNQNEISNSNLDINFNENLSMNKYPNEFNGIDKNFIAKANINNPQNEFKFNNFYAQDVATDILNLNDNYIGANLTQKDFAHNSFTQNDFNKCEFNQNDFDTENLSINDLDESNQSRNNKMNDQNFNIQVPYSFDNNEISFSQPKSQLSSQMPEVNQSDNQQYTEQNNHHSNIHLDWTMSLKLSANNESLAIDLLTMLINSLPEEKNKINAAFNNNQLSTLKDHVHKLHGACCFCGVPQLKQILKNLEGDLNANNQTKISAGISALNSEIEIILQHEKSFFAENTFCTS